MPRLIATVYVKDPETFQWVTCEASSEPEPRLAALILTPSAWEGGEAPGPDDDEGEPDPAPSQEPAEPTPPAAPAEVPAEAEKKPRARRPAKPADE